MGTTPPGDHVLLNLGTVCRKYQFLATAIFWHCWRSFLTASWIALPRNGSQVPLIVLCLHIKAAKTVHCASITLEYPISEKALSSSILYGFCEPRAIMHLNAHVASFLCLSTVSRALPTLSMPWAWTTNAFTSTADGQLRGWLYIAAGGRRWRCRVRLGCWPSKTGEANTRRCGWRGGLRLGCRTAKQNQTRSSGCWWCCCLCLGSRAA